MLTECFYRSFLVICRLKRGIGNKDSRGVLKERLERCPSNLQKFFNDMWNRHREDKEIYLHTATAFFNYNLTRQLRFLPSVLASYDLSPWELLVATNDVVQASLFNTRPHFSAEEMTKKCEEIVDKIIEGDCNGLVGGSVLLQMDMEIE
jgi:hypothetical protein